MDGKFASCPRAFRQLAFALEAHRAFSKLHRASLGDTRADKGRDLALLAPPPQVAELPPLLLADLADTQPLPCQLLDLLDSSALRLLQLLEQAAQLDVLRLVLALTAKLVKAAGVLLEEGLRELVNHFAELLVALVLFERRADVLV
eukprot:CAMPEP_0119365554 /NCGR_PEP_ID=MMETSP1334-20130426/12488_1 /TAXON_ID=127549 /ORGANISM="Calcidiscus leptoporus, Strain RCC1130" /LENGTH=145 /DNA_ID=CAMNT_0007381565 /DNA_START=189 /DNA_END=622 /DNA_ORIENTATION=-